MAERYEFDGAIYRQGMLRCVDVPDEIGRDFDDWAHPPVVLRAGGVSRATTLMRRADGGFRVFVHDDLRRGAGVDTGDTLGLSIELDESPAEPFPDELIDAAAELEGGLEELEILPPGLRREMVRFIGTAKSEATRHKRVARCLELLAERAERSREAAP